jgi:transcriptional regulator NrdR family protein
MSRRLLTALRNVAQDAETVAAAARKVLRELDAAHAVGTPIDHAEVERQVRRIERRLATVARRLGVQP